MTSQVFFNPCKSNNSKRSLFVSAHDFPPHRFYTSWSSRLEKRGEAIGHPPPQFLGNGQSAEDIHDFGDDLEGPIKGCRFRGKQNVIVGQVKIPSQGWIRVSNKTSLDSSDSPACTGGKIRCHPYSRSQGITERVNRGCRRPFLNQPHIHSLNEPPFFDLHDLCGVRMQESPETPVSN